jgi:hypothetical protein
MSILFLIGCLSAIAITWQIRAPAERKASKIPDSPQYRQAIRQNPLSENNRLVYPYSVISGGVLNREELVHAVSYDRVVAEHYRSFKVGQAKIVAAEETRFMHVSYRIGNKVFWTAKKLKIPKGETLISDGRETARTRCGNMVSIAPQEPVSEEEPAVEIFDVPVVANIELPKPAPEFKFEDTPPWDVHVLEFYTPPTLKPPKAERYYPPVPYYVPPSDILVPESGTLCLLTIGLSGIITIRFARHNKKNMQK